ncbi:MAG: tRNA (adenosine(37)-N6)-dimethylallyltransferase MiaA [Candidatus Zixiibacteriota bacterium]
MDFVPIICGPTGSGKSSVVHKLAKIRPIEVISADSRQLVRHLDIGTAKPSQSERQEVPYHLIDLIEPGERYSAFRFIGDATRTISEIRKRGHLPVIVGGTGLYLRALTEGVVEIEEPDFALREKLEKEAEEVGSEQMHARLKAIDPLEAAKIHPNNRVKIIRALEIYYLTGKTKSELTASGSYRRGQDQYAYYCLAPIRELLYDRINARVDQMIAQGWREEVSRLAQAGFSARIRAANIIGYSELLDVEEGVLSLEEALARTKQETRRYAKRQLTWFRNQTDARFFKDGKELQDFLESVLV